MLEKVWVKYKSNGAIREVFKGFYEDHHLQFELLKGPLVASVPKDKEEDERELLVGELRSKGIPFHPSCKLETLRKKLEK